jgi:hypothetical protein
MKKFITVIASLCLLFILFWIGSAYWSIYQIKLAIDRNQPEIIEKYIDFPRVQESLKQQIEKKIAKDMGFSNESNQNILGKKLNNLISTQLVDVIATPETIRLLIQGKVLNESYPDNVNSLVKPLLSNNDEHIIRDHANITQTTDQVDEKKSPTTYFSQWNKFIVVIPINQNHTTQLTLEPSNWKWKIVDIRIINLS